MKNILLIFICVVTLTFGTTSVSKAQLVHIPDANFRAYINIFFPGCMVGDSINPACPAVLAAKIIDVSNRGITNLSGIEVFVNDTLLYCQFNLLTSLPNLPQSITYLYCGANPLNSIPNLPPSLIYFHCGSSSLTSLPTLPSSLIELQCYDNQLTSLPTLPSSLAILECSGNQLTSLPNLPATLNFLRCTSNQLTSLPNSATSLTEIHCSSNQLTSLPNLPTTLIYLFCNNNQLTSIPTLPASLTRLYCRSNQLTSLSTLSTSLFDLDCSYNQLTTLSNLPASLTNLDCDYNQLAYLPNLPSSLTNLNCIFNQLTSLPALPASLTYLNCIYNQLTSLPALPASLTSLECHFNQLASLPALPASLTNLFCHNNLLTSIPTLPASLTRLDCYNNQLTSLPGLASLIELNCHFNQLTSLPGLASLNYLSCSNNQLTSLPALPASLTSLFCSNNQLTSLPSLSASLINLDCSFNQITSLPTLSGSLISLYCSHNQLTAIPILPDSLTFLNCRNNPLLCLPDLNQITYLDFFNTQINCLPGYGILQTSYPAFFGFPICDVFNTNGCDIFWNIEGSTFIDTDTNCNLGSSEPFLKNQKLNLYKNGVLEQQTFSNEKGDYDLDTFSFNFYKTECDTAGIPFEVYCPASGFYLDTITVADSMKYDRDFGLKCKEIDLAVTSIYTSNLRPASIREIKIEAGDYADYFGTHCAAAISGTVNITISGPCNYSFPGAGALVPNSIIGNVITYNIADFGAISYDSSFNFNILVDMSAALGSQICIQVSVSTTSPELNYNNNLLSQCFTVVGSFDPNDKTAFPNSTLDVSGDRWLTYLIRFQNTGTASAEHIFITDTLSSSLDWSTFNLLSYSHQLLTQVYNDGLVKFSFPHINLPDSNTNEPASHGYVQYKIRAMDSLLIGSTIENTANIFFDFNAPVITNTTSNAVINCSIPPTIITASICNGDAYSLNGALYYIDGTYQQKLITNVGCDSIIELQLTVNSINNTVSQSSAILQTTAGGSGYQWIDCATNTAITNATNSTYQPTQSGDYAVAVTYGNCIDTSSCFSFSMVGLPSSIGADVIFQTRYNSNSDFIQLHAEKLKGNKGVLRLMDISGRIIFQKQIENIATGNLDLEIPAKGMNAGIYLVNLITELDNISGKVVKY